MGPSAPTSTFPVLEQSQHALVDAIVARLPPSASSFEHLQKAYHEVLAEHGLDASETEIYGLLLKLGLGWGRTWKEKWDVVNGGEGGLSIATSSANNNKRDSLARLRGKMDELERKRTPSPAQRVQSQPPRELLRQRLPGVETSSEDELPSRRGPMPVIRFSTPRARPSSRQAQATHLLPVPAAATASSPQQARLESTAMRFRHLSLLGLSFDAWTARLVSHREREAKVDAVRDALAKRVVMHRWLSRAMQVQGLRAAEEELQRRREERTIKSSWDTWLEGARATKKRKWEEGLRLAWEEVKGKKDRQLVEAAFETWRHTLLAYRADRFRAISLAAPALRHWHSLLSHHRSLEQLADSYHARSQRQRQLWSALGEWRARAALKQREKVVRASSESRVLVGALRTWRARLSAVRHLGEKCDAVLDAQDAVVLSRAWGVWMTHYSGELLGQARTVRLLRGVLGRWKGRLQHVQVDLRAEADSFRARQEQKENASMVKGVLGRWKARKSVNDEQARYAGLVADRAALSETFTVWRERAESVQLRTAQADIACDFFLQRRMLRVWALQVRARKIGAWVAGRNAKQRKETWEAWRARLQQSREEKVMVARFKEASDCRILANSVGTWMGALAGARLREQDAEEAYDALLRRRAWKAWEERLLRLGELWSLGDSFKDVAREELLRRSLRTWVGRSRRVQWLEERLEGKLRQQEQALLLLAWERWTDQAEEARLQEAELAVLASRRRRMLELAWSKWAGRSKMRAAIAFERRTVTHKIFVLWKGKLPHQAATSKAVSIDREAVLGRAFEQWRAAHKERSLQRAASRFRASGSSSSSPPFSSTPARRSLASISLASPTLSRTPSPRVSPSLAGARSSLSPRFALTPSPRPRPSLSREYAAASDGSP